MQEDKGWISLYRKFLDWEWYDDANVMRLFIHLLLCANHKDNKWRGKVIRRGEVITSQSKLAHSLKLSIMQIRNSLNKLKSTGEITVSTTADYSVISIKNFNLYQEDNRLNNRQTNQKQQASNRLTTTNNNDNKRDIYNSSSSSSKNFEEFYKNLSEEEEEVLKKYSKGEKIRYFRPWLRKIFEKGDFKEVLSKAIAKDKKEKQKAQRYAVSAEVPPEEKIENPADIQVLRDNLKFIKPKGEKNNG